MKRTVLVMVLISVAFALYSCASSSSHLTKAEEDAANKVWEGDWYLFQFRQYEHQMIYGRPAVIRGIHSTKDSVFTSSGIPERPASTYASIDNRSSSRVSETQTATSLPPLGFSNDTLTSVIDDTSTSVILDNVEEPRWLLNPAYANPTPINRMRSEQDRATAFADYLATTDSHRTPIRHVPSEQDIDTAIAAYEEALRLAPSGSTRISYRQSSSGPSSFASAGGSDRPSAVGTVNIRNLLTEASNVKQNWLTVGKAQSEQRLASEQTARQTTQAQQAAQQAAQQNTAQAHQIYQRANEHFIAGRYTEAIADYQSAIGTGSLIAAETADAQRLITEAQQLPGRIEAASRRSPLEEEFEVKQNADNTVTITRYKPVNEQITVNVGGRNHTISIPRHLVIPSRLYGLSVTVIGQGVFYKNNDLHSVIIPDTVTEIEKLAFWDSSLAQVTLGRNVRVIGEQAFENTSITEIIFPASLTSIGYLAFSGCRLTSVTLPASLRTINYGAFSGNPLQSIAIPAGIQTVGLAEQPSYSRSSIFSVNQVTRVVLPANINNNTMVIYGFDEGLRNFYVSQNRAAGTYVKNGPIWTRQ